jgi:hypothetical protein
VYGCWATMTEAIRDRPCYADRVGKAAANHQDNRQKEGGE